MSYDAEKNVKVKNLKIFALCFSCFFSTIDFYLFLKWAGNFKINIHGVFYFLLKLWQNKKSQIFVWGTPKMVSFSQLPAVTKNTIFGAAPTKLGPSYFVRALVKVIHSICFHRNQTCTSKKVWNRNTCFHLWYYSTWNIIISNLTALDLLLWR